MKLFSVAEMVAVERAADAAGVSYDQMMETAGRGVAEAIIARCNVPAARVLVLVGPGNNGGDGLVAGRYLAEAGAAVTFFLYRPRDPEIDHNAALVREMELAVIDANSDQEYQQLRAKLHDADILIDALLGTGVTRAIGGHLAELMGQVNAAIKDRSTSENVGAGDLFSLSEVGSGPRPVKASSRPPEAIEPPTPAAPSLFIVAVDSPSGLNCDTGHLDPLAFPAQLTVTFAGPKRGHFRFPGATACGELVVAGIGIPTGLPELEQLKTAVATSRYARDLLPQRPADGHKGSFGTALIAAGSSRYWGAPVLAARAAYRVGAGLVALAVPEKIRPATATQLPEATYPPLSDQEKLAESSARWLRREIKAKAMLVGPGIGDAALFLNTLLEQNAGDPLPPLVVDADGLNLLAQMDHWPERLPPHTILTPHPGEMARLMGIPLAELKGKDRLAVARQQAVLWGHVLLLKGAFTVVAEPNGSAHILPFAIPALGTAGSGDVLAGVIVGLLAQGVTAYDAAVLGGYLHAAAGQLAGESVGDAGLLAGEIADQLPAVRMRLLAAKSS